MKIIIIMSTVVFVLICIYLFGTFNFYMGSNSHFYVTAFDYDGSEILVPGGYFITFPGNSYYDFLNSLFSLGLCMTVSSWIYLFFPLTGAQHLIGYCFILFCFQKGSGEKSWVNFLSTFISENASLLSSQLSNNLAIK